MGVTDVEKAVIWEDTGVQLMGRVTGSDGSNITQSDITSITRKLFDLTSATPDTETTESIAASEPVVATVVFDSLQNDDRWDEDSTGYNFRAQIEAAVITEPHRYSVEYMFTPVSGEQFRGPAFEVHGKKMRSS